MKTAVRLVERGIAPDALVRWGIRRLLRQRLREESARSGADADAALDRWIEGMRAAPVALVPEKANEQHYEVPAELFEAALGPRLKYSSCWYPHGDETLAEAEEAMLALSAERAELADGQRVLELGCGWGSLTLWMAERYPASRITAVSNSAPQRRFIEARARERGLANVEVLTRDMNAFRAPGLYDRVVSVEMLEHMRNWEELLRRVHGWLEPDGRMFVHVFTHRRYAYPFEVRDETDWMSEHFFSGGMMPSDDLMERIDAPFAVAEHAVVDGTHYARTADDWLANLDARRDRVMPVLERTYGAESARLWLQRWRVFFMACSELFGWDRGREWQVSHYRLAPEPARRRATVLAGAGTGEGA